MVIWLAGDVFNIIGALLQNVLFTMILLATWYTLADVFLLWQCLAYRHSAPVLTGEDERTPLIKQPRAFHHEMLRNITIVLLVICAGVVGYFINRDQANVPQKPQPVSVAGQVFGWICSALYLCSRMPQIKLNYDRKSCDGIAFLFFMFTALGNITYCVSILAADSSPHALFINASWIIGAAGSLFLDLVIFVQFWIYRDNEYGEW